MSLKITISPSGHTAETSSDISVLDAALKEGLMLNHSCREGHCGTCKGQIVKGVVDHGDSAFDVLTEEERQAGKALFCCAKATSDLEIYAPEVTELKGISIQKIPSRVVSIDKVTSDVAIVRVQLPPENNFTYYPGQYMEVILKDGSRRHYSMASMSKQNNQLEWHIRLVTGGKFSTHVFETMKIKEMLRLEGPYGSFYLRESQRPIVFVASGTGIAPVKALIEQLIDSEINARPVYLYWGGRKRADLYLNELLEGWHETLDWLEYTPVLSDSGPECEWLGRRGFVHQQVLEDFDDLKEFEVYACGAPIVVDSSRQDFVEKRGLKIENFFSDSFL